MSRRLRIWALTGISVLVPAFARGAETPILPPPAPLGPSPIAAAQNCTVPTGSCRTPRIVVEMSPPEVVFQRAEPSCVKAPSGPSAGKQALYCYPISPSTPHAAYPAAPALMPYPAPMMSHALPAPVLAPAFAPAFAPPLYPVAPAAAFAPMPAQAPCGAPGFASPGMGSHAGPGPSAADFEAMAAEKRAVEETVMKLQLADLQKRYNALAGQAAAMGLSPSPLAAPSASPHEVKKPGTPSASPSSANDPVLKEIAELREEIDKLWTLCAMHHRILKDRGLIPPAK